MKSPNGKFGCMRALIIFWLGILAIGFLEEHHTGIAVLLVVALVYVVLYEPINGFLSGTLDIGSIGGSEKKTSGAQRRAKVERSTYESIIGDYRETPVAYIAEMAGLSEDKVIGDLMRLVDEKVFAGGQFDDQGNFILPENTRKRDGGGSAGAKVKIKCPFCGEKIPANLKFCYYCGEPLDAIKEIDTIRVKTIAEIEEAGERVPEGDAKNSIKNIAEITDKIIRKYEEEPELIKDSSKFREYYLPESVNAITNYAELCSHEVLDREEQDLKDQIERSLPTIEEAFSKILRKVSIDGVYDLSADVSTLEVVLKQDGLLKSDFEM